MAATEGQLGILHEIVARSLVEKIQSGEASASDYSNAIKMLKDNSITCVPGEDNALGALASSLKKAAGVSPANAQDLSEALDRMEFDTSRAN